jgi:hypothetical protein
LFIITGGTGTIEGMAAGGGDGVAVPWGLMGPLLLLPTLPNLVGHPPFWDEMRKLFGALIRMPALNVAGSK